MVAGLSFGLGQATGTTETIVVTTPSPSASTRTVVQEKEVERKVEVPTPYVPGQCKDAVALARQINDLVAKYEAALGKENDILADAYTAVQDKNINELNAVSQRQINLKSETIGLLIDIRDKNDRLTKVMKQCEDGVTR